MAGPNRLLRRAAAVFGVASGALTAWLLVASLLPNDVAKLAGEYPPIEDRSGRVAARSGCALDEIAKGDGGCAPAAAASVRQEEVSFASSLAGQGVAALTGTLSIPAGAPGQRRAAVVLVAGPGPEDRHEAVAGDLVSKPGAPFALFDALSGVLSRAGLVVLQYDKRTCATCYGGRAATKGVEIAPLDLEVDARDALAFLATRAEVDPARLVVLGHSEGGQIAPFVARGRSDVAAVILLGGLTETFDVALLSQLERLSKIRAKMWDPIGAWSVKLQKGHFAACFGKLEGPEFRPGDVCLGGGVTQGALAALIAHDKGTAAALGALTVPVMALQGSVDRNVDPEEIPGPIAAALAGRDRELHYVRGVNHLMVDVLAKASEPVLSPEVARRLTAFVASVRK